MTEPRSELCGDITTDVAVVGGGLTGLLTAYSLKKAGIETVVLEKGTCASGVSGNSTAKITAAHRLIYDRIADTRSIELARAYANENNNAIERYAKWIKDENIDCDFERVSAFVYACDESELSQIKNENRMLAKTSLRTHITNHTELPFKISGAIEYKDQAQFNPYKFSKAISKGLEIYENTKVIGINGNCLKTEKGSVTAKKIILCSHYPIFNFKGAYFIKLRQEASYALAVKSNSQLHGMYIGVDKKMPTFRRYRDMIIMGGESKKTGKSRGNEYRNLLFTAKTYWTDCTPEFFWYAQDCVTTDNLPYIGKLSRSTPNILVATGFGEWGMTTAMVASQMLTSAVADLEHPLDKLLSPSRTPSVSGLAYNIFSSLEGYASFMGKQKFCTHMGCPLSWNKEQKTWDCPCHGSRFDRFGNPIESPAIKRLK